MDIDLGRNSDAAK
jgi:hypothetical protein